jgi:hypothetical protein
MGVADGSGAKSGALEAGQVGEQAKPTPDPLDPDLAAIIDRWPTLPADVRRTLAAVVRMTPQANGEGQGRQTAQDRRLTDRTAGKASE